jgi:hypothetical protein
MTKQYSANSIDNTQLQQKMLIEQNFAGFPSINDTAYNEVKIPLQYLLDLFISKEKSSITYPRLERLATLSRYLVEESVKLEDMPVLVVRYTLTYDYATVPAVNNLTQLRTGKVIYDEVTNEFKYRFVVNSIPNVATFDIYKDSNFVITDVPTVFTFGNLNFENWLQSNRFLTIKEILENYFDSNFTIKDMIDYITLNRVPSLDSIKYLSNALELIEALN